MMTPPAMQPEMMTPPAMQEEPFFPGAQPKFPGQGPVRIPEPVGIPTPAPAMQAEMIPPAMSSAPPDMMPGTAPGVEIPMEIDGPMFNQAMAGVPSAPKTFGTQPVEIPEPVGPIDLPFGTPQMDEAALEQALQGLPSVMPTPIQEQTTTPTDVQTAVDRLPDVGWTQEPISEYDTLNPDGTLPSVDPAAFDPPNIMPGSPGVPMEPDFDPNIMTPIRGSGPDPLRSWPSKNPITDGRIDDYGLDFYKDQPVGEGLKTTIPSIDIIDDGDGGPGAPIPFGPGHPLYDPVKPDFGPKVTPPAPEVIPPAPEPEVIPPGEETLPPDTETTPVQGMTMEEMQKMIADMQAQQQEQAAARAAQEAEMAKQYMVYGDRTGYNPYLSGQYQSDPYGPSGVPDMGGITTIPVPGGYGIRNPVYERLRRKI